MAACSSPERVNPFFEEWDTPYGTPPFSKILTSDYLPAIEEGLAQQKADIAAIIANPEEPTFENTIAAYDRPSGEGFRRILQPRRVRFDP